MKTQANRWMLLSGLTTATLCGCASSPFSNDLRQQAQPLTVTQVAANPKAYAGTVVIWGGTIIKADHDASGDSLYVLQLPLRADESPQEHAVSPGRFIARRPGPFDPAEFKPGRLLTVAGKVDGAKREPLQNTSYDYPIIDVNEVHVWHREPPLGYYPGAWGNDPYWRWDMYGPYWTSPGFQ